jgi:D-alanine-D-alanine ligase
MKVAVCFNTVPPSLRRGEASDRISEQGAEGEAKAVAEALGSLGHAVQILPLGADAVTFAASLQAAAPEAAFNLCEGFWGESRKEMHVAALYGLLGLPFTGSAPLTLGLTQDKVRTKELLLGHGLPTPRYLLVQPGEPCPETCDLAYPLIVKPRFEDASLGITTESVVESAAALKRRIAYLHATYRQGALVEEFIEGREINAAVLGNDPSETLPLSEIRFAPGLARPIVSYAGKWLEESAEFARTEPVCPAPLTAGEESLIKDAALRACRLLDCRDYARVDIRLRDGVPYILEVNANPDLSPDAGLARAAGAAGIAYPELIERILDLALQRKEPSHAKP